VSDQRGFENESKSNTEYHILGAPDRDREELSISMAPSIGTKEGAERWRWGTAKEELPLCKIESLSACGSGAATLPTTGDMEYRVAE
jgi:hypothetical protein